MGSGKSIDFDRVARWYDLYVSADFDVPYWLEEARAHPGRRLELMCGTGRLTLPLRRAGLALTGADYCLELLRVLRAKGALDVVAADARALPFRAGFDWIFIGFHAFAELATPEDQLAALRSIRGALASGGRLSLALHNPAVRGPQLDGQWRELGRYPVPGTTRTLAVRGRFCFAPATGLATGLQHYRELGPEGRVAEELELPVRFRLIDAAELARLADAAGFATEVRWGGYDRRPFAPTTSPVILAELSRR